MAGARRLGGIAVLLGIIVQTACGARDSGTTAPSGEARIPTVLVGTWGQAAASGSQYCDPNGGGCTSAYGGSESYALCGERHVRLLAAARGEPLRLHHQDVPVRDRHAHGQRPRLTLTPTSARNQVTKTCGRSTDEQLKLDPSSYSWRVEQGSGDAAGLYLTSADGEEAGPFTPRRRGLHRAGAGGNYDWADLYCETTGYGFACRHRRAAAGENYDRADDAEEAG